MSEYRYSIPLDHDGEPRTDIVYRLPDRAWIPCDASNADYAAFLEWLADGNTPEPWPPAE